MNAQTKVFELIEFFQSSRDKTGNILGLSVGHWLRYYRFLLILKRGYDDLNLQHIQMTRAISERTESVSDVHNEFMKLSALDLEVHLRIESFYLFSKILLDRTADTFNYCFNTDKSSGGSSFTKMQTEFATNCLNKELVGEKTSFLETMGWLQESVVRDRNKRIEHADNPRVMHGFRSGLDNTVMINRMVLYPTNSEDRETEYLTTPSAGLEEIFQKIDLYLIEMADFLRVNKEKIKPKI